jgi:hypothetical protein
MLSQRFAIGTEIAAQPPLPSENFAGPGTPPTTLKELVDIIAARGDKNLAMLRTTTVRLSEFMDKPTAELSIDVLVDVRSRFSDYLKQRHYAANSVRTYRQNTQRLVRWAEQLGWVSGKQSVEEAWKPFLDALAGNPRAYTTIIFHAIQNRRPPSEFSISDLDDWGDSMLKAGRQYRTVRSGKWNFRRAVANAGLNSLLPKLESAPHKSAYKVPAAELPEPLRTEVRELLVWKQARFAKGRPQKTRHRPASAKLLESNILRLFGFARNIGNFSDVTSLRSLFTEEIVSAFVEWGLNERGLTRSSLLHLSMIYGAMRHHPKYKDQDYGWFSTLLDEVPEDDPSVLQEKQAKKSVAHEDLCKIPVAMQAARMKLNRGDAKASRLAHDQLLILWLTTLPWRQRNLRECRIGDPKTANVFFAPLPPLIHIAKPKWVEEALTSDPKKAFWQFYFREDETKTGQRVRGILPRRLIPLLEEYLADHRPRLVAKDGPGTLFVNEDGCEIDYQIMTYHISEIVLKHTGRRMTPHLFRNAFAYSYLVLLCYNRLTPQNGHWQSWRSRERARMMRKVAMECGLCLSGRMRTSGFEVGRQFGR